GLEEDEVARLELRRRHPRSLVPLRAGVVREADPELGVDVHREAGAVEARHRVGAAPAVGDSEVALGDRYRFGAGGARGWDRDELRESALLARVGAVTGNAEREPGQPRLPVVRGRGRLRRAREPDQELGTRVEPEG